MLNLIGLVGVIGLGGLPAVQEKRADPTAVTARVETWWPSLSGKFRQDDLELILFGIARDKGTSVGFEGDLGLESEGPSILPSLSLAWDGTILDTQKVDLRALYYVADGSEQLDADEVVGDNVFPAGTWVESRLRVSRLGASYGFEHSLSENKDWRGEIGVGLDYLRSDLEIESVSSSESEQSADLVLLLSGGVAYAPTDFLDVGASLGLGAGFSSFLAEGGLRARFAWGPVSLDVGYRFLLWSFDDGDEKLDLRLLGPAAGLSVRF